MTTEEQNMSLQNKDCIGKGKPAGHNSKISMDQHDQNQIQSGKTLQ